MGATLSTIDNILKEKYLPTVREAMTNGRVLLEKVQRNSEEYDGKKVVIAINKSRNSGLGAAAENGTLPTAGNQGYVDATFTLKYVYGRGQFTGQVMELSKTNAGAFAKAVEREMKGLTRDFKNDLNRIYNGAGDEVLATVAAPDGAVTTLTVDSTRFLNDGDLIDINGDQTTITTVDSETTCTIPNTTVAAGESVKRRIGASVVDEPDGIGLAIDSGGTFGAIVRSTAYYWQSKEMGASGVARALTLSLMDQLNRSVETKKGDLPDAYLAKPELRDVYGALLQADSRYVNTMSADGQKKKLSHKDVPFETEIHAAHKTIFAVTWDTQFVFESGPVNWMDDDGAILHRVTDKDAYEFTLRYYSQYGSDNCRINAKLTDISES